MTNLLLDYSPALEKPDIKKHKPIYYALKNNNYEILLVSPSNNRTNRE